MSTVSVSKTTAIYPATTPANLLFIQRSGASTNVPLSGTYTGTAPSDIEVSWQGGAYSALSATVGGGTWSGAFSGQASGEGTLIVREANDHSVTATITMAIGDVFVVWGDSTAVSGPTNLTIDGSPNSYYWFGTGPNWEQNVFAYQWGALAEQITHDRSYPTAFINAGASGSKLSADWQPTQGDYVALQSLVTTTGVNAVKAMLGHVSVNDVQPPGIGTPTETQIRDRFAATAAGFAADIPGAPPTYVAIWANRDPSPYSGDLAAYRADCDTVRQGMLDAFTAVTIVRGSNLCGELYSDLVHPSTLAQVQLIGRRWYLALKTHLYGGSDWDSPRVSSIVLNGAKTAVTVTCDQALSNSASSSVAGFRVMDDGSAVTISAQTVTGSTRVTLTLADAIVGTCTVSYGSADDAVGVTRPMSEAHAMADTSVASTETTPMEPFFNQAVTDASESGFGTVFAGVIR